MNLVVKHVPVSLVHRLWPVIEPFIADAAKKDGGTEYTVDQIKLLVANGSWLLLVAADDEQTIHGAATVNFINYPNERIAFVTAIGGKLITNENTFAQLQEVCRANGATKIQGLARESIARLWHKFGFSQRAIMVEYKL
jgi:hypothetical protein